jgi:pyrimidine-nucleoside phosphorylase
MRAVDIIEKTRDKKELTHEELRYFLSGYLDQSIPEYQMSAWLMAVYFQGLSATNLMDLVQIMVDSGETLDLSSIPGIKVDKHSTGGVGDKTSLVVGPLVAACGVTIAKMSGRGLGHTGGTIDKLESIPGYQSEITASTFTSILKQHKVAIVGQSPNLVPLDKHLYGLRDVTATVSSIPLIAASIMSKKLASGADKIVLDVKVGNGSFMEDVSQARLLAKTMVDIGNAFGKTTIAVLTDMSQPLGEAVGNQLEVEEAIDTLEGKGPKDFTMLCKEAAVHLLDAAGIDQPMTKIEEAISTGKAYQTFVDFIAAQGGSIQAFNNLPSAPVVYSILAESSGVVSGFKTKDVGHAAMLLGAGRATKQDLIDPLVGVKVKVKIGDKVNAGDVLYEVYAQTRNTDVDQILKESITIGENASSPALIIDVIH